jgi:hypothetical protein
MQAQAGNDDRTADAIVARVVDVLQVEGGIHSAPIVSRVVALLDGFAALGERAIAQKKPVASEGGIAKLYGCSPFLGLI